MVRPNTPSVASSSITAMGISSSRRCQPWAASVCASAKRRICPAIMVRVSSSRPGSPKSCFSARRVARAWRRTAPGRCMSSPAAPARIDTQICGPDRLPLADSDAAGQLAQVLLEAQRQDQSFALAQLALCLQARRPGPELFQRRARRRRPGQTVDRKLLIAQARPGDGLRDAGARRGLIVLNRGEGGGRALEERAGIIEPVGQTCGWGDGHGA